MGTPRASRFITLLAVALAAIAAVGCGSSSPMAPSAAVITLSNVSFNSTSVTVGGSVQGTVSLSNPASGAGATITLSSSNTATATVPSAVMIPAGTSSADFSVSAVAAGTAAITATLNGTSKQSPLLTVTTTPSVALASLDLGVTSVTGGQLVFARVTLTGPAPAGGASVAITAADPISAPPAVVVLPGLNSVAFSVLTHSVVNTTSSTITAAYGGITQSQTLQLTPPTVATASFGVTGPTETETCTLINAGSTLDCTFNGSTSSAPGPITAWDWSYGSSSLTSQTTSGPMLAMPAFNCGLIPPAPLPEDAQWLTLTVKLVVHDDQGHVSAEAVNSDIRLFPTGSCGY